MLRFTQSDDLRIELYEERIKGKGYVHVDKVKLQTIYMYEKARMETFRSLARKEMNADAPGRYLDMSKQAVLHYLINVKRCPPEDFYTKKAREASLDAKNVLIPLMDKGYAVEFLENYITFSSLKSVCARVEGLPRFLSDKGEIGPDGQQISRLYFNVEQQQNLRYNYHDTDLISIPKEYTSAFTVEDGYVLAWGDFAQSDFRIAYNLLLRDESNAKIMDACEDKYEGIARVLADFEKTEFDVEQFRRERDIYKVNVLQTIYGQRGGRTKGEREFVHRFTQYLKTCPRYIEFYNRINNITDLGLPVPVTGYFGYTQHVPYFRNRPKSTIDKALNTPIQTGTSQIIILTINAILDMFYSLGYTEEDVSLYMVRHDEPVFKLKKEVLKDAWVFNQASKIIVDNWTPLELSFSFGYYYGEEDEGLTKEAVRSYVANSDKIVKYTPDNKAVTYMPVPDTMVLSVSIITTGDGKSVVCVYSSKENSAKYILVDTDSKEEAFRIVKVKIIKSQEKILKRGSLLGVVVYNEYEDDEIYDQSLFFKFKNDPQKTFFPQILARYMAYRYSVKYSIPCDIDPKIFEPNAKSIQAVGELDVIEG